MNKLVNFLVFFLLFSTTVLILIIVLDLEITPGYRGANIPYKKLIFSLIALVFGFLLTVKSLLRWFSLWQMKRLSNTIFSAPISGSRKQLHQSFLMLEAFYLLFFSLFFFFVSTWVLPLSIILLTFFVDTLIFYYVTTIKKAAGTILTHKAVGVYDRQLNLIPLANMKEADIHFDEVFIYYKGGFTYHFSMAGISNDQVDAFKQNFFKILNEKNVFISENLRNYSGS